MTIIKPLYQPRKIHSSMVYAAANNRFTYLDDQSLDKFVSRRRLEAAIRTGIAADPGEYYNSQKEDRKAECLEALRILPDYAPAHLVMGNNAKAYGNDFEAKKEWKQALQLGRPSGRVYKEAQEKLKIK